MSSDDVRRTRPPLQKALLGAVFPLSREQLLLLARENEAPPLVLSLLSALPPRRFESLDAVEQGLETQTGESEEAAEASQAPVPQR
jgi:hypothetical protein